MSAIIPTFNRRDQIVYAVSSIIAQTYPAACIEIIVVDDGGTDDTADVVRRLWGDRVRVLRKPNGGVASARNHGLAAARGEYLAFLDSDDEWFPTKIEKQVAFLAARPHFGMVLTDVELITEARVGLGTYRRRPHLPVDGYVLRWVLRTPTLVPPSLLMRRAVYEDVGGFDESLPTAEDLDYYLGCYLADPADTASPYLDCLGADLGRGVPPTFLVSAALDPLHDDSTALAAMLHEHHVICHHEEFDGVLHGFLHNSRMLDAAVVALQHGGAFLRRALDDRN